MPDKMHQEIEEILARLDREAPAKPQRPPAAERSPISLVQKRKSKKSPAGRFARQFRGGLNITPTSLLFVGAGTVVAGLLLSYFASPLIWAALAGVLLFIGAFIWSFFRSPSAPAAATPRGVYWRDRYIEYESPNPGPLGWFKRKFRR